MNAQKTIHKLFLMIILLVWRFPILPSYIGGHSWTRMIKRNGSYERFHLVYVLLQTTLVPQTFSLFPSHLAMKSTAQPTESAKTICWENRRLACGLHWMVPFTSYMRCLRFHVAFLATTGIYTKSPHVFWYHKRFTCGAYSCSSFYLLLQGYLLAVSHA